MDLVTTHVRSPADGNEHEVEINSLMEGNSCEWNREHVYAKAWYLSNDGGASDAEKMHIILDLE